MEKSFHVSNAWRGGRLDKFLSENIDSFSRTKIHCAIMEGNVLVNGIRRKPSYRLKENDLVYIKREEKRTDALRPFELEIPVIFEDDDILIIDKPAGISVHPPNPGIHNTLVNALIYMKKDLSAINALRPGVVHRLDKETSGVMVLAKNNQSHLNLVAQFRERKILKEYVAICWGLFDKENLALDLPLARDSRNRLKMKISFTKAKKAHTDFSVLKKLKASTVLSIKPLTGRMHQIRVHLKFLGYPIVGDKKYGTNDSYGDLFLHAHKIGLYHPKLASFMEFVSPLPVRFKEFINSHNAVA